MGKKKLKLRWTSVDDGYFVTDEEDDHSTNGEVISIPCEEVTKDERRHSLNSASTNERFQNGPRSRSVHTSTYYNQRKYGWNSTSSMPPRFERRSSSENNRDDHVPTTENGGDDLCCEMEDLPNGFTKIRSKNLDVLFRRDYYAQKYINNNNNDAANVSKTPSTADVDGKTEYESQGEEVNEVTTHDSIQAPSVMSSNESKSKGRSILNSDSRPFVPRGYSQLSPHSYVQQTPASLYIYSPSLNTMIPCEEIVIPNPMIGHNPSAFHGVQQPNIYFAVPNNIEAIGAQSASLIPLQQPYAEQRPPGQTFVFHYDQYGMAYQPYSQLPLSVGEQGKKFTSSFSSDVGSCGHSEPGSVTSTSPHSPPDLSAYSPSNWTTVTEGGHMGANYIPPLNPPYIVNNGLPPSGSIIHNENEGFVCKAPSDGVTSMTPGTSFSPSLCVKKKSEVEKKKRITNNGVTAADKTYIPGLFIDTSEKTNTKTSSKKKKRKKIINGVSKNIPETSETGLNHGTFSYSYESQGSRKWNSRKTDSSSSNSIDDSIFESTNYFQPSLKNKNNQSFVQEIHSDYDVKKEDGNVIEKLEEVENTECRQPLNNFSQEDKEDALEIDEFKSLELPNMSDNSSNLLTKEVVSSDNKNTESSCLSLTDPNNNDDKDDMCAASLDVSVDEGVECVNEVSELKKVPSEDIIVFNDCSSSIPESIPDEFEEKAPQIIPLCSPDNSISIEESGSNIIEKTDCTNQKKLYSTICKEQETFSISKDSGGQQPARVSQSCLKSNYVSSHKDISRRRSKRPTFYGGNKINVVNNGHNGSLKYGKKNSRLKQHTYKELDLDPMFEDEIMDVNVDDKFPIQAFQLQSVVDEKEKREEDESKMSNTSGVEKENSDIESEKRTSIDVDVVEATRKRRRKKRPTAATALNGTADSQSATKSKQTRPIMIQDGMIDLEMKQRSFQNKAVSDLIDDKIGAKFETLYISNIGFGLVDGPMFMGRHSQGQYVPPDRCEEIAEVRVKLALASAKQQSSAKSNGSSVNDDNVLGNTEVLLD